MPGAELSPVDLAKIEEWARVAFDYAVADGFVTPPWRPSDRMYGYLFDLYLIGFTPAEAAQASFATRH